MDRFAPEVHRLDAGPRVVLWHGATGRHLALFRETLAEVERWTPGLPPPPALEAVARRLDELSLLRESAPPDLARSIPARSRRVLLLPAVPALWLPLPAVRTPGGFAYAERRLSPAELALWRAFNGARSTAAASDRAGQPLDTALAFLADLTHPAVQAVQLWDRPLPPQAAALSHLVAPDRPPAARPANQRGAAGETTLEHWHLHAITDGERHFDDVETTVAHAFALPHPALGGEPYGGRLHRVLEERGLVPDYGLTLEIGPGDGELGEAWLARARAVGRPSGEHVRLDRSPELLATQRRHQPGTREILGSATDLPLKAGSVSLVVCNEVMADLTSVPFDPADPHQLGDRHPDQDAWLQIAVRLDRYGIAAPPGQTWMNLGAWQLVEQLDRVLAPGGVAFLSEFGSLDEPPRETLQLDQPEVSIHFGHLLTVARGLGFEATCLPLADLLEVDLRATWLARPCYEALRARMRAEGHHLAARAWTLETLALPWPVEGLWEVPVAQEGPGPLITRFMALLLRKRRS